MLSSQNNQPTFLSVAPRFVVQDMEQAQAFYGQLAFKLPIRMRFLPSSNETGSICT
jgi:hypothetical protein